MTRPHPGPDAEHYYTVPVECLPALGRITVAAAELEKCWSRICDAVGGDPKNDQFATVAKAAAKAWTAHPYPQARDVAGWRDRAIETMNRRNGLLHSAQSQLRQDDGAWQSKYRPQRDDQFERASYKPMTVEHLTEVQEALEDCVQDTWKAVEILDAQPNNPRNVYRP